MQTVSDPKHAAEAVLVKQVAKGDQQAFAKLFYTYKDKLYGFCLRYVKSDQIAEEIVQDTFLKLWERRSGLDPEQCLGAYLYRIAYNKLLNQIRRATFERSYKKDFSGKRVMMHNHTENAIVAADLEELALQAVGKLPAQRQTIFRMSRIEGLSHREIAKKMKLSPNTVKVQINKALKTLKAQLFQHVHYIILLFCCQ